MKKRLLVFAAVGALAFPLKAQQGDAAAGEKIFQSKCSACHTMGQGKLVGPDLAGVLERRDREWVVKFIRNSQELVQSGDEQAVAVFNEFKIPMPPQDLTDQEMHDLLAFLAHHPAGEPQAAGADNTPAAAVTIPESTESRAWRATLKSTSFHITFWVVTAVAVLTYLALAFIIAGYSRDA